MKAARGEPRACSGFGLLVVSAARSRRKQLHSLCGHRESPIRVVSAASITRQNGQSRVAASSRSGTAGESAAPGTQSPELGSKTLRPEIVHVDRCVASMWRPARHQACRRLGLLMTVEHPW